MSEQTKIALPFKRSSHRQINDADGNLIVQVYSGGCGIEAADAIEELIVRACNRDHAFGDLVAALKSAKAAIAGLMETDDDGHPSDHALHLARCATGDINVALAKATK